MRRRAIAVVAAWSFVGFVACGDDDGSGDEPDASMPEMGVVDLGTLDMGGDDDAGEDAGPDDDAGPIDPPDTGPRRDAGMLGDPCDRPGSTVLEACADGCGARELFCLAEGRYAVSECGGTLDEPLFGDTVFAEFDTRTSPPGHLSLLGCVETFPPGTPLPPQFIVPYTVPGTGLREVVFTTANDGTDPMFDTEIQVRRSSCDSVPETGSPGFCLSFSLSPDGSFDARAGGLVTAMGGDTLHFVVSGAAFGDARGRGRLEITTRELTIPVVRAARAILLEPDLMTAIVQVEAEDAGRDIVNANVEVFDAMGTQLDVNGDGRVDVFDTLQFFPSSAVQGDTPASVRLHFETFVPPLLVGRIGSLRFRLSDGAANMSAPFTTPIAPGRVARWGEPCDATNLCTDTQLRCGSMGRCQAPAELEAVCAAATTLTLSGSVPRATATTRLEAGPGATFACGASYGEEAAFFVTVPTGRWDLIASTRVAPTPTDLFTIVYSRASCGGSYSDSCDEGTTPGGPRAELAYFDVPEGRHTIFVELPWSEGVTFPPTDVGLEVRLRPVLAAGAACDPMQVSNRCADGLCVAGTCPMPPGF